ncbi:MAG TPA: carboxypeptidase regulatory-like domain-containing protein [Bryobacteraceae bacterium]|nr:carboxypeptidase regulatory-like domain-containing protein [Bryobacteraceae bacterium]
MTNTLKASLSLFLAMIVAACWLAPAANAQAISGDLVGAVTDASGAAIPNVTVTAVNTATNVKSTGVTNGLGEYRIGNLPPGTYEVSVQATGFANATLKGVAVELNQTTTANLKLSVGTVTTTVDVSEAGALLDTTTAQIQQTFTAQQVQDLPMATNGQGVLNLSLLQSGVASSGGVGYGTGPSVGGQRPTNNNFTVDGVDNNSKSVTGPVVYVPNDDVAEFTLLANQFRAEYGHSSGGQFNTIVKTGGNTLHFELYEYFRNRDLNAVDQLFRNTPTPLPRYDQNRLGANIGGPIIRNKWFIFGGFEYNPYGGAASSGSIYAPTSAGYSTLAGIAGVSQTNLNVLKTYAVAPSVSAGAPSITVGGVTIPTGAIPVVGPNFQNAYFTIISTDYNFSDRDQLRGRYIGNKYDSISTAANLPVFYTPTPDTNYLATAAWYHTFSPTVVNEFRLGFNRNNQSEPVGNQTFPGLDAFPNLQFLDLNLQVGPNSNYPQSGISNSYQAIDNISKTYGSHTLKAGYEFRDYIAATHFTQRVRGDYEYTTLANYLMDLTPDYLAQRSLGDPVFYGNGLAQYGYFQDTWRIRRNLTLDAGLRYEWSGVPVGAQAQKLNAIASVPGLVDFRAPNSSKTGGFAPRIGLAWTPEASGNTVIRAGFSRATDIIYDNLPLNSPPPQFTTAVDVTGAGGSNFLKNGGISAALYAPNTNLTAAQARAATAYYLADQILPYSLNWSLEAQHTFAKDYTFTARYVGTRGVHELIQQQIDRLHSLVTPTSFIPTYMAAPSASVLASLPLSVGNLRQASTWADPAWAAAGFDKAITSYQPQGWSFYNGLDLQLQRRFAKGLQFLAAYTYSHNIDNQTATLNTSALSQRRVQDFGNLTPEKAASALDRRQRLTISGVWDLPYLKNSKSWFVKNLIGNWQFSPVLTYETPEYFTVSSSVDSNLNGDTAGDRTILNPSGVSGTGTSVYGLDKNGNRIAATAAASSVNNVVAWVATNPNARYIQAGPGALSNTGRNTEATRGIANIDFTIIKRFQIGDKARFEISGEAYNLFNHAQFIPGSIGDVGRVSTSGSTAYTSVSNVNFNNPEVAFSSNPRLMQVVAKFYW